MDVFPSEGLEAYKKLYAAYEFKNQFKLLGQ